MVGRDRAQGHKRRKKALLWFGDLHIPESLEGEKSKNFQQCPGINFAGCFKNKEDIAQRKRALEREG
jgi:hypothetical protein